jgi:hypothetical protein
VAPAEARLTSSALEQALLLLLLLLLLTLLPHAHHVQY